MNDNNIFEVLSKSLTQEERRELLDTIRASISLNLKQEDTISEENITDEERNYSITRDIEREGFFLVLWLKILRFFTGKSREDSYVKIRIKRLLKKLRDSTNPMVGSSTKNLTPQFAQHVYSLYLKILPLRKFYTYFWSQDFRIEVVIQSIIFSHLNAGKREIIDFIPQEKLEEIYSNFPGKEKIRGELIKAINKYIKEIPDTFFSEIELTIKPLYYLRYIVMFRFKNLLDAFGLREFSDDPEMLPDFKETAYYYVASDLQVLYYALYVAEKISQIPPGMSEIIEMFYRSESEKEGKNQEAGGVNPDSSNENSVKEGDDSPLPSLNDFIELTNREFKDLIKEIESFKKNVSLSEIITYFRGDPYFNLLFYLPGLNLREFYLTSLQVSVLGQLDEKIIQIKQIVNENSISQIFEDHKLEALDFYKYYPGIDYSKFNVPFFNHYKSIQLLKNFSNWYYNIHLKEPIVFTANSILLRNRTYQSKLIDCSLLMNNLARELEKLDSSLSPDTEMGKNFSRLRYSLGVGQSNRQLFRDLVKIKDKEASRLLDRGVKVLERIIEVLESLTSNTQDGIKLQLSSIYPVIDRKKTLQEVFEESIQKVVVFKKILLQTIKLERGK